jgi:flagellar motor switch protein FliN/FliY
VAEVFAVELTFGSKTFSTFHVLVAKELIEAFAGKAEGTPKEIAHHVPPTLDRLLDVELSLSVSFGRTSVPVHDILKLSSGSIVELNCRANDLVEIIVNDCMIARGEVVVIEGNYGVRVLEIISRGERMALSTIKGSGTSAMRLTA